jgi:hypothetical protein
MKQSTWLVGLLLAASAFAQTSLYVPDNDPTLGTCNAIPMSASFGSGATTYLGRIPASFLDPTNRTIRDVEFAPCAAGSFSAPDCQIGIGHVSAALPLPFTYPTFDAAGNVIANGSFLDFSLLYNSVVQGPFTWNFLLNAWSPLGLDTAFSPAFTWNGTDDIAFYITYRGATGGASLHRTTTEPLRVYANAVYQGTNAGSGGNAGAKMGLVTGFPSACGGCGGVTMGLSGSASIGGSLTAAIANYGAGLPFVGVGFGPFCQANLCPLCTIGHNWQTALFGTTATLTIPNQPAYIGVQVGFQGIGLMTPGGCASPMVAFSNTIGITILP